MTIVIRNQDICYLNKKNVIHVYRNPNYGEK